MDMKQCTKCLIQKPLEDFNRCSQIRDGHHNWCKVCKNAYCRKNFKQRYSARPDTFRDYYKAYYAQHKERIRELQMSYLTSPRGKALRKHSNQVYKAKTDYNHVYYVKNKDKILEMVAKYHRSHPNIHQACSGNRRSRARKAPGKITLVLIDAMLKTQQHKCYYCGKILNDGHHVDHKIALSRGGTNWPNNLCLACQSCNLQKHTKTEDEFKAVLIRRTQNEYAEAFGCL